MSKDKSAFVELSPVAPALEEIETSPDGQTRSVYFGAETVFNELPEIIRDYVTAMTKAKYSKALMAMGTISDSELSARRTQWLIETVSSMHKSWEKANAESAERAAKKFYDELRKRGYSVEAASKTAKYNPLT